MDEFDDTLTDSWAARTVAAVDLARTLSTWLFVGAALALVSGVIGVVAMWSVENGDWMGGGAILLSQSASTFTSALLPAGLLAAAGAALRLQAARTEALPSLD